MTPFGYLAFKLGATVMTIKGTHVVLLVRNADTHLHAIRSNGES